jgi:signal transduction histidine kinase
VQALAPQRSHRRFAWPGSDVLVVGFLAIVCQLDVWQPLPFVDHQAHRGVLSAVFLASSLALRWRRRAPVAVLAFIYTIQSLMYLAIGAPEALGAFLPQLVAIYSVGRYSDARNVLAVGPLVLLGTAMHEVKDPQFELSGPAVFYWALLAAAWPLGRAFRQRELAVTALSQKAEELERRRRAEAVAARAAERARISRELHDVVGHGVSVIVLQLVAGIAMLDEGQAARARQRLVSTERSARQTLAEMRRLLGLLHEDESAELEPQPGLAELERLVADTRAAGVAVDMEVEGEPVELPAGLDLAAYRVAQEALTNVIKHAQPAAATVRVSYVPGEVTVDVIDDGRRPAAVTTNGGRGLAGMRERVDLYGGELTAGPRAGGGFEVRASFPIEDA